MKGWYSGFLLPARWQERGATVARRERVPPEVLRAALVSVAGVAVIAAGGRGGLHLAGRIWRAI